MRLLICLDCKTIEELPDYNGPLEPAPVPAPDGTLREAMVPPVGADAVLEHLTAPHARREHTGNLVHVDNGEWGVPAKKAEILKQLREGLTHGVAGLGADVYELRDTLHEDAMKCFERHRRPKGDCVDWHDRSKLLGNSLLSDDEKKVTQRFGFRRTQKRFLCDFCPVATHVQTKRFSKEGLYN